MSSCNYFRGSGICESGTLVTRRKKHLSQVYLWASGTRPSFPGSPLNSINMSRALISSLGTFLSFFLFFFFVAYEFLSADYKIWNTNGEALFAFPPPKAESLWWERARHFEERFCINNNLFHTSTFCVNFRLISMWLVRSFLRYNTTTIETTKNISGRFIQFSQYIKQLSHEVSRLEKSLSFRVSMNEQHWW